MSVNLLPLYVINRLLFLSIVFSVCSCSEEDSVSDLRETAKPNGKNFAANDLSVYDREGKLNYCKTLLYSFYLSGTNSNSNCITCITSDTEKSIFAQAFSFVGDNVDAIRFCGKNASAPPSISDSSYLKKVVLRDARQYLIDQFKNSPVLMFNEAHDRVQTRSFLLSLLQELRKAGAENLALETLYHRGSLNQLDNTTGHYTAEPVCGQIVREALRLGYHLIPYEDTSQTSSFSQRDSIQATNLVRRIIKPSGIEKTIVLAGYDHVSEQNRYELSMAQYFKKYSGIDPITINQTDLIESPANPMLRPLLDRLFGEKIATTKILDRNSILNVYLSMGITESPNAPAFDMYVYFPPTTYLHSRPDWLLTSSDKQLTGIPVPKELKPVLIQSYVSAEIKTVEDYETKVPYDQTFTVDGGKAWLVLDKKSSYKIVFRDEENKIIHEMIYLPAKEQM